MIFKITHFYITGKLSPPPVATATEKEEKGKRKKKKEEKTKESNYQFTLGHWEGHCSPPGSMLASCGRPHISHKCEQSDMGRLHMPCHYSMHSRLQPSSSWGQAPPCCPPRQPSEPRPELRLIGWTWHRGSGLPSQSWHSPGRGRRGSEEEEGKAVPGRRLKEVPSFTAWTRAFCIYAGVVISAHPSKARDLLAYIALLSAGAEEGDWWRSYDRRFSQQLAPSRGSPTRARPSPQSVPAGFSSRS